MSNRCINNLSTDILSKCFSLKEVFIFTLPDINVYSEQYIQKWKKILRNNLYKISDRHTKTINISLETIRKNQTISKYYNRNIELSKLFSFLISFLIKDYIVFITINNYKYPYGYLIIPGEKLLNK